LQGLCTLLGWDTFYRMDSIDNALVQSHQVRSQRMISEVIVSSNGSWVETGYMAINPEDGHRGIYDRW
jgi:hypothetical protein